MSTVGWWGGWPTRASGYYISHRFYYEEVQVPGPWWNAIDMSPNLGNSPLDHTTGASWSKWYQYQFYHRTWSFTQCGHLDNANDLPTGRQLEHCTSNYICRRKRRNFIKMHCCRNPTTTGDSNPDLLVHLSQLYRPDGLSTSLAQSLLCHTEFGIDYCAVNQAHFRCCPRPVRSVSQVCGACSQPFLRKNDFLLDSGVTIGYFLASYDDYSCPTRLPTTPVYVRHIITGYWMRAHTMIISHHWHIWN